MEEKKERRYRAKKSGAVPPTDDRTPSKSRGLAKEARRGAPETASAPRPPSPDNDRARYYGDLVGVMYMKRTAEGYEAHERVGVREMASRPTDKKWNGSRGSTPEVASAQHPPSPDGQANRGEHGVPCTKQTRKYKVSAGRVQEIASRRPSNSKSDSRGAPEVTSAPRPPSPHGRVYHGDGGGPYNKPTSKCKASGRVQEVASRPPTGKSDSRAGKPEVASAPRPPSPGDYFHHGGLVHPSSSSAEKYRGAQQVASCPSNDKSAVRDLPELVSARGPTLESHRSKGQALPPLGKDDKNERLQPNDCFQGYPSSPVFLPGYECCGEDLNYNDFRGTDQETKPSNASTTQLPNDEQPVQDGVLSASAASPQNEAAEVTLQGFTVSSHGHLSKEAVGSRGKHNAQVNREEILRNAPLVEGTVVKKASASDDKGMERQEGLRCINTRAKKATVCSCSLVVLTAIIVAVTIPLVSREGGTEPQLSQDSLTWTTQPPVQNLVSYEATKEFLETVSSKGALEDASSPQHQALSWVSAEADATGRLEDEEGKRELVQRYALATVYFATGGPTSWLSSHDFLSGKHVCDWNQVVPRYEPHNWTSKGAFCTSEPFVVDVLKLALNNLTGSLPDEIGLLSGLQNVTMYLNKLRGTIPSALGRLQELKYLSFSGNLLTGSIPGEISQARQLASFFLAQNKLSSSIPPLLGTLEHLTSFSLQENALSGSLSFPDSSFQKLQYFSVKENHISGSADVLFSFKDINVMDCSFNKLTGTLPSDGGRTSKLRSLDLANNSLHGSIPESIDKWPLEYLQLVGNSFTSSLPSNLGQLTNLTILGLSRNKFEGALPSAIGNLVRLTVLTLNDNELTGFVPPSFAKLTSLDMFLLENNNIRGNIDFMCNISIDLFGADCHEPVPYWRGRNVRVGAWPPKPSTMPNAEVTCSCCSHCCGKNGTGDYVCEDKSHGEDVQEGWGTNQKPGGRVENRKRVPRPCSVLDITC